MKLRIARPLILNQVLSPYGIAFISTAFFVLAWVFPPQLYSSLVKEPDLMFLDAETLLFFLFCIVGFWAGLLLVDFVTPSAPLLNVIHRPPQIKGIFVLLPLIVTTGMTILAGIEILRQSPNLLVLLLSQQGGTLKQQAMDSNLGLAGWGTTVQPVVLWWTYWKLTNTNPLHGRRFFSWMVFVIGLLAQLTLSIFRVSRSDVMPVLCGLGILFLLGRIRRGEIKTTGLARYILLFVSCVLGIFIIFGMIRGGEVSFVAGDFIGYTIAGYNRLAALLHGTMHYPYGGRGLYLSGALSSNNLLNSIVPLKTMFGWPNSFELWNSEFQAPQLAGLNSMLIWSGAFGYLFSDFGWATPLIIVIYGILYGLVWKQMKAETAVGLALYPWFAFSALSWFGPNLVSDYRLFFFFIAGLLLMIYEKLISLRSGLNLKYKGIF